MLEWSSFWASVPAGCALLGLGSGGIRALSFPAVSLTGSGDELLRHSPCFRALSYQ